MGTVHFLNVGDGDCSVIKHLSDNITVIDICNGNDDSVTKAYESLSLQGNYNQKAHPVNPIKYIQDLNITYINRFILTHPDMDHMDGIKRLFSEFKVGNLWDTDNNKTIDRSDFGSYKSEDWDFYQKRRKEKNTLFLLDGATGKYFNRDDQGYGGDNLQIFCPTQELIEEANRNGNYNDASYVILYNENGKKILFAGDSEDREWDVLLDNHEIDLRNIDVLIAPHHGRKSGGNNDFLDVLRPKITLFGNADCKDLNYNAWNYRNLRHYTNNEGGTFIFQHNYLGNSIDLFCTYETFARKVNYNTYFNTSLNAWYIESF